MKLFVLFVAFVFCNTVLHAQKLSFTDPSNRWRLLRVNTEDKYAYPYEIAYTTDTGIGAYTYRRFTNSGIGVRADTARGLLYFRYVVPLFSPVSPTGTVERVLFDYSLRTGDTFKLDEGTYHFRHVVQQLDSVRTGGYSYRAWHMDPAGPAGGSDTRIAYIFIEGLGTLAGPAFSAYPIEPEDCLQLRCFSSRGISSACTPALPLPCYALPDQIHEGFYPAAFFDNRNSCELGEVAIHEIAAQPGISHPNPGGSNMQLRVPADCQKCTARVYDATGRMAWEQAAAARSVIPIGQYLPAAGVYFYILQDAANGRRYTGRFVFQ